MINHHQTTANRPSPAVVPIQEVTGMRYRLVVRVTAADIGQRVTIRWRPPELDGTKQMTDVLGILEDADDHFFKVRRGRDGQLVVIPRTRAFAGKVVPPAPPPRRPRKAPGSSWAGTEDLDGVSHRRGAAIYREDSTGTLTALSAHYRIRPQALASRGTLIGLPAAVTGPPGPGRQAGMAPSCCIRATPSNCVQMSVTRPSLRR
jgi:hypothetical protein